MENFRTIGKEIKIVVLGSGGVGKSALTVQFVQGIFLEKYDPTIEDSYRKTIPFNMFNIKELSGFTETPQAITLEILDTAGTEQFPALRELYIKTGQAFVLVYSITSIATLSETILIRNEIIRIKGSDKVPIVLVSNKCDLGKNERDVSFEEGERLAKEWNIPYIEASAKKRINVDEVFITVSKVYLLSVLLNQKVKTKTIKDKTKCTVN